MKKQTSLLLLRLATGWYFLYAGFTKIINPSWSAAGYLKGAQMLKPFYDFFSSPGILPITNFLNEWGLTLIGLALIIGVAIRFSSVCGIILMVLYYLVLPFPHQSATAFIVDDHILLIVIFLTLIAYRAEDRLSILPKLKAALPSFLQ